MVYIDDEGSQAPRPEDSNLEEIRLWILSRKLSTPMGGVRGLPARQLPPASFPIYNVTEN